MQLSFADIQAETTLTLFPRSDYGLGSRTIIITQDLWEAADRG
jgi:hypothetical protein